MYTDKVKEALDHNYHADTLLMWQNIFQDYAFILIYFGKFSL
jgi:hypothetical protein